MKLLSKTFFLVVAMTTGIVSAQVATGTPPFSGLGPEPDSGHC
jgi:hypothetical protein